MKEIKIVVIGHKDCGKSTLIGRLLYDGGFIKKDRLLEVDGSAQGERKINFAFLLDTFEEEKEKGLTIDIVHTRFRSKKYLYTFIDCPGHKELIKNMLSGASEADAALLLVSARKDEGIQMQTKQHLFITKIIGIEQIVVAVTKMDTVNYKQRRFDEICYRIKKMLYSIGYKIDVSIVPISGLKGDNLLKKSKKMPWYREQSLIRTLDKVLVPAKLPVDKPLRVPVQDIYTSGGKTLVVGRVESGRLRVKDEVVFYPSGIQGKIDKLLTVSRKPRPCVQGRGKPSTIMRVAKAGENVAFALKLSTVNRKPLTVRRGDVCGDINAPPHLNKRFIGQIIFLQEKRKPRPCPAPARRGWACVQERGKPLTVNHKLFTLHCGTMDAPCQVKIIDRISPMGIAKVEVFISSPGVIEKYLDFPALGRFVICDEKEPIAAGIVLERE